MSDLSIDLPQHEWATALWLLRFALPDERQMTGMVHLAARDGVRRWSALSGGHLASVITADDPRTYEVLVSPRLVHLANATLDEDEAAVIGLTVDADGLPDLVTVTTATGTLTVSADRSPYLPVFDIVADSHEQAGSSITLDADGLWRILRMAAVRALPPEDGSEDDDGPLFWLEIDGAELRIEMAWTGLGRTTYRVPGHGEGSARRAFPPKQVADALEGWEGPVVLHVPDEPHAPLRISDSMRTVLVLPVDTTFEITRDRVESVLTEVFGPDVLHRDDDGDYPLTTNGIPIYARLADDYPPKLQIFAPVLGDIVCTPELLAEINDHNAALSFARLYWLADQVLAESDLVAASLDPAELATAFDRVREVSENLAPMLHTVHGGTSTAIDAQARIDQYRRTVVEVEVGPGTWVPLTGSGALGADQWPYDGVIHVLTAYDPAGRSRPQPVNEQHNLELAQALLGAGAGLARARGADPESEFVEPGFVTWGLGRDAVVGIARTYDQEAIFELDAAEARIVFCGEDRVDARPRVTGGPTTAG